MGNLFQELKRRKVARAAVVYLAAAFAVLEFSDIAFPRIGLSDPAVGMVLWAGLLGFPIVLVLAWYFDLRSEPPSAHAPGWFSLPVLATAALLVGLGAGAGSLAGGDSSASDFPELTITPSTNTSGLNLSGSWVSYRSQPALD